jgi:LysM repeat protein
MTRIAQRFNMSLETLLAANPQMSNPRLINPGETINIDCGVGGIILPNTGGDLAAQPGNGPLYTIRSGDTLPGIAARYQTTLGALLQANPELNPGGDLHPGQTIHLPNG